MMAAVVQREPARENGAVKNEEEEDEDDEEKLRSASAHDAATDVTQYDHVSMLTRSTLTPGKDRSGRRGARQRGGSDCGARTGTLKTSEQGLAWKSQTTRKVVTLAASDVKAARWTRVARGYELRIQARRAGGSRLRARGTRPRALRRDRAASRS